MKFHLFLNSLKSFIYLLLWKYKIKCCPFIDLSLSPYPPSVPMNYTLHNGEPYACSFKFFSAVQSLKSTKQFICILHIKSYAVVFYIKDIFFSYIFASNLNNCILSLFCEFHGIVQKIKKDQANHSSIASSHRKGFDVN